MKSIPKPTPKLQSISIPKTNSRQFQPHTHKHQVNYDVDEKVEELFATRKSTKNGKSTNQTKTMPIHPRTPTKPIFPPKLNPTLLSCVSRTYTKLISTPTLESRYFNDLLQTQVNLDAPTQNPGQFRPRQ